MKQNHFEMANSTYLPVIFSLQSSAGTDQYDTLISAHPEIIVHDLFELQKKELIKTRCPGRQLQAADLETLYKEWLAGKDAATEGCWVYYPWLNTLVHLLEKGEFIELRTNRN